MYYSITIRTTNDLSGPLPGFFWRHNKPDFKYLNTLYWLLDFKDKTLILKDPLCKGYLSMPKQVKLLCTNTTSYPWTFYISTLQLKKKIMQFNFYFPLIIWIWFSKSLPNKYWHTYTASIIKFYKYHRQLIIYMLSWTIISSISTISIQRCGLPSVIIIYSRCLP